MGRGVVVELAGGHARVRHRRPDRAQELFERWIAALPSELPDSEELTARIMERLAREGLLRPALRSWPS